MAALGLAYLETSVLLICSYYSEQRCHGMYKAQQRFLLGLLTTQQRLQCTSKHDAANFIIVSDSVDLGSWNRTAKTTLLVFTLCGNCNSIRVVISLQLPGSSELIASTCICRSFSLSLFLFLSFSLSLSLFFFFLSLSLSLSLSLRISLYLSIYLS